VYLSCRGVFMRRSTAGLSRGACVTARRLVLRRLRLVIPPDTTRHRHAIRSWRVSRLLIVLSQGSAEPNVRVQVRRRVVQVERQHARVRAVVPVAAAKKRASRFEPYNHNQYILSAMVPLDNVFSQIISLQSLAVAHKKALRGKRASYAATKQNYLFMSDFLVLQHELRRAVYTPRPYRRRNITEPKPRHIAAPAFRDRIVHHAIHAVLSPFYERLFIRDSYACRPGKGIHKAMARVQDFLRANPQLYVCKIDISKYYPSVNHAKLKELLARKIADERLLHLLGVIIDSYSSGSEHDALFAPSSHYHTKGPRGIPIGNLTSQLFANIYLHEVDMFVKQVLHARQYVRYMDDMLLFHTDKAVLQSWKEQISTFLYDELYLTVHPKKVRIFPSRLGVDFVGYVLYAHKRRVRADSVRRFRRRFRRQLRRYIAGEVPEEKIEMMFNAWAAHARHGGGESLVEQLRQEKENYQFVKWVWKQLE